MTDPHDFLAAEAEDGKRLDVTLAARLDRSRNACAALIKSGHVRVNGRPAKPAHVVSRGERVQTVEPEPRDSGAQPQDLPIRIVYEEKDFCVVDKPPGMATHPAPGAPDSTLVNALLAKMVSLPVINGVRRPGIVHRLDKDTSGLLIVAKSEKAMLALSQAIAQRQVTRLYDAVVHGIPPNRRGLIDANIGRDPRARTKFTVREDGRRALTHYQLEEAFRFGSSSNGGGGGAALLRLKLETGRTHQIRVHCAAMGNPIVGDRQYSADAPDYGMRRQALHAAELSFTHPFTGWPLRYTSPWPEDFAALVDALRRRARA